MNVIFINLDSVNRRYLDLYNPQSPVRTPNLDAFAEKAAVFNCHYSGSVMCMPARREFLTGTQEFLWRPWGPLEPFDMPLPRIVRERGGVSQLITDHYHYIQHGAHSYVNDFSGYHLIRGHEYDNWVTAPMSWDEDAVRKICPNGGPRNMDGRAYLDRTQYLRNTSRFEDEKDFFAPCVFSQAGRWLAENHTHDSWFLMIDCFDPHEPFHVPEPYASMYTDEDPRDPELPYWTYYGRIEKGSAALSERQLRFVQAQYSGKVTMVDTWLGHFLDTVDELQLWDTTAIILTSDHGHFLGEHGYIGKPNAPLFNTMVNIPLLVWHPDSRYQGEHVDALTSAVDLYATMVDILGAEPSAGTHGKSVLPYLRQESSSHRQWALYGYWGRGVNITDGRYTYLRAPNPENAPLYAYSTMHLNTMPLYDRGTRRHVTGWFLPPEGKREAESGRFLPYTDLPCWRYTSHPDPGQREHLLFGLEKDPEQQHNRAGYDTEQESRLKELLTGALREMQAPDEQFERLGL